MAEQQMGFCLAGRVAVVTGAASGIGAGIAATLATAGATVALLDIDIEGATAQAEKLQRTGQQAEAFPVNLADEDDVIRVCGEVIDSLGVPWVLVNNAGLQDRESFLQGAAEEWDRMNHVNARGPFLMSRELARAMVERGEGGRIVNIASAALRGSVVHGLVAYTASKGAMLGLSGATAFELAGAGITVNTVLPGGVATPGAINASGPPPDGPARRSPPLGLCQPDDIAAAVQFFASPAAAKVTNQVLAVDGGFSIS
jgi:NAD(P)-dependent dehydrogenase (short-subunit alcohol dehydrogenase family)